MYFKAESYIASEQASNILYENGITPIFVSDNPVLNAQHVVFEAAKGYHYGLPYHAALASVTSAPAELLGMGERIGKIKSGFDADVVVWDSDPLSVGATPVQVWIDGTPQFPDAITLKKAASEPIVPNKELGARIKEEPTVLSDVVFTGISKILIPGVGHVAKDGNSTNVVIEDGKITCTGLCDIEIQSALSAKARFIDLKNGHLSPPFTAFGSWIGLTEIKSESSTQNGDDTSEVFSRAVDGLQLDGKHLRASYSHGVTKAISAPAYKGGGHRGISVGFSTGAIHSLEEDAVWSDEVSVHYTLSPAAKQGNTPSISSAVGDLRKRLLKAVASDKNITDEYSEIGYLQRIVSGEIPLVISVHSADTIAAILRVKADVETVIKATATAKNVKSGNINLVLLGGGEAHLVAKEIAEAGVSVVLAPVFAYANSWDLRRSLTGAPVTNGTTIDALIDAGVLTAIASTQSSEVRNLPLLAGIIYRNSEGRLSEDDALALVGKNLETILRFKGPRDEEFVVFEGHPLEIDSRIKAVGSRGRVSVY